MNLVPGVFVVLFAASIIIFMFVFFCLRSRLYLSKTDPPKPDRRKGFSNRTTAVMFVATAINFLLTSLVIGTEVSMFIVSVRKALILDTDFLLSEKLELVKKVVWKLDIAIEWTGSIPVSTNRLLPDFWLIIREDVDQRSHRHLEGMGPFSISTAANPPTIYSVDWSRG